MKRWLRKTKRKVRRPFEIGLVALWMLIGPRLSRKLTLRIARIIGTVAFKAQGRMYRIAKANLDHVFGDELSAEEVEDLVRQNLFHSALTLADVFWFSRKVKERLEQHVTFEEGRKHLDIDRPTICITAHYGNWEILGQKISQSGYRTASVAQPLVSSFLDQKFIEMRKVSGQEIIPSKGAVRRMLKILSDKGRIGLLVDQNTMPRDGGIFVDFFGTPIPCSASPAMMALRKNAVILFGFCCADENGHYTVRSPRLITDLPSTGTMQERIHALTQEFSTELEKAIRQNPAPWTWSYKRFRHIKPGTDASQYPAYALPMLDHEL